MHLLFCVCTLAAAVYLMVKDEHDTCKFRQNIIKM